MTIFLNNLRRIFKSKYNLVYMVILPVILIIVIIGLNSGNPQFSIAVVDNDNTKLTKTLIQRLEKENEIKYLAQDEIKNSLINSKSDYAIVIPKGFTQSLIHGEESKINGYAINGINYVMAPKNSIENFISSIKAIAKASHGDEELFYEGLDKYKQGSFKIKYERLDNSKVSKKTTSRALGFLVFNMLMLGTSIARITLKDKKNKIYNRILGGPIKPRNYTLQNLLSFLVVVILQVVIIFIFMINVFKITFPSLINMFLLFLIFCVFVVAFGLFISSNSKDMTTASALSTLMVTPMAMIGGCFWSIELMPKTLQNISKFVPVSWMMQSADKLLYNGSMYSVLKEISIVVLFTIVFLLLASWRKKDVIE
jgi:ABC-2 type transport system permease protein